MNEPRPFDPTRLELATDGDSRQRKWARRILAHWPRYEEFWRRHVVPLTFAPLEEGNYFLRPTLPEPLEELADADYAVFFHLAQMHEWTVLMKNRADARYMGGTEQLYAFFSHGTSLVDATCSFAAAVDTVAEEFGGAPAFEVERDEAGHVCGLGDGWGLQGDRHKWEGFVRRVKRYRNFLVHRRPVFLQNEYMPRLEYLESMSGLAAISRLARDPSVLEERYEEVVPALEDLLVTAAQALDAVWITAGRALPGPEDEAYARAQGAVDPGDRRLTKARIVGVREL